MGGSIMPVHSFECCNHIRPSPQNLSSEIKSIISASFDTLVPLLPSKYSYLAIDLPGHGFSSHLPKGCFYHIADYIAILDGIRSKFKWEKLSLLGHSMGGT